MSVRQRLRSTVTGSLRRAFGVTSIESLTEAESDDLRVIARLYQVIDREPVFAAALEHVISSVTEHFSQRGECSPLLRALRSRLLNETGQRFEDIGHAEQAQATRRMAAGLNPGRPDMVVARLLAAIAKPQQLHDLKPLMVDAIVRALLTEVHHTSQRVDRAAVLCAVAWAAGSTGNLQRLRTVTDQLAAAASSPGYRAILTFYEAQLAAADGAASNYEDAAAMVQEIAATLPRSDPAYQTATTLATLQAHSRAISAGYGPAESSALNRAAEAMRRQHWREAVRLCEQGLRELTAPAFRASMRVFAEIARMHDGQMDGSAALNACVDRLVNDDLLAARSLLDVEGFLVLLLVQAIDVHTSGGHAAPATRIADLMGEFRGGAAIGRGPGSTFSGGDARADLTLIDFLTQRTVAMSAEEVAEQFPDHFVVWVNLLNSDDGFKVVTCTLPPGSSTPLVRRTLLNASGVKALAGSRGERSEKSDPDLLGEVARLFFADLGPVGADPKVVVVPDSAAWNMPWSELAPPDVTEFAITASMASAARLRPVRYGARQRVIGVFDDALPGAQIEMTKLRGLAAAGRIEFVRASSLAELEKALHSASFDLLTIGVHGTTGDGFEYRFLLPDGDSSPAALLRMPLPPTVVLGCCWSATSAVRQDTVAASLACLVAGASQVIGGLWAIDDAVAGELLARTYESYFAGTPLPRALRGAHLSLDPAVRPQAAGLVLIGRI